MTILSVLIECISVVMCKVKKYILIYDVKTEHPVMAKKLKFVKIFMCTVWSSGELPYIYIYKYI